MNPYPKTFSHIGISVPNLEEAVAFYENVMGWYTIMKPTVVLEESDTAIGKMCIDVFGKGWGSFKIVHLALIVGYDENDVGFLFCEAQGGCGEE